MVKRIIDEALLKIIVCPVCRSKCTLKGKKICCSMCGRIYPIVDGIPIMLPYKLNQTSWDNLYEKGVRGNPVYGVDKTEYSLRKILNNLPPAISRLPAVELLYNQKSTFKLKSSIEIGSGTGGSSLLLKKLGLVENVILVDTSMHALKLSRKLFDRFGESAYFIAGDGLALPFDNNYFDISISCGLLEHFKGNNKQKIVSEHCRVANNVLCQVPAPSFAYWLQRYIITLLNHGWPFGYEKPISDKEMENLFFKNGFKIKLTGYHDMLSVFYFFLLYRFNLKPLRKTPINRLFKTDVVALFVRDGVLHEK